MKLRDLYDNYWRLAKWERLTTTDLIKKLEGTSYPVVQFARRPELIDWIPRQELQLICYCDSTTLELTRFVNDRHLTQPQFKRKYTINALKSYDKRTTFAKLLELLP